MESPALHHPRLQALYALWAGQGHQGEPPCTGDIEPADLRPWIGNMILIDVEAAGSDAAGPVYRYSYYSQFFAYEFGEDKAGQSIDSLPEDRRTLIRAEYDRVVAEGQPVARVYTAEFQGQSRTWERLVLPLFSPDGPVDKLMVAAYELDDTP